MPNDYQPIWSSTAGRDSTYTYESTDSFDPSDSGEVFMSYLIGDALSISDLSRERDRQFTVKATVDGVDYNNKAIVDFEIDNSLVLGEEFEIGTAVLSKLVIKLKTSDTIAPNAKIVPSLAMAVGGERVTDWYPMGEFYVDSREQIKDVWEFTCYDKLVWADVPYISALTYPATQQAVWDEICTSLGYTYDSSVVINPSYMIQAGPAGYSKRQVLGYIASANSASVYIGKDGNLKFRRFAATDRPVSRLTASDYVQAKQLNPVKTYTRVVVIYNTEDGLYYEAGTGDENHTLYVENPFATQAITNDLYASLNGFSYTPVTLPARGYPDIEAGDRIRYGVYVGTPTWETADVAWQDADFSWDGYKSGGETLALHTVFRFAGGLKMSIEAPSKSEQQSEFVVEGALSQQINRLNQNAVKQGRSYYGVSITRNEGFIVEREDHLSKAILNSDELTFYAESDRAIWFDVPSRRYKFKGTLEATDGVFSGSLSAATGTFTGTIQSGSFVGGNIVIGSGNDVFKADSSGLWAGHADFATAPFKVGMDGKMSAVGAEFSGKISASEISGGTIVGTNISTGASYPMVEISSTDKLVRASSTSIHNISIYALDPSQGSPSLEFQSASFRSGIRQGGDTFVIAGLTGPVSITAAGLINFIAPQMTFINTSGKMAASSPFGFVDDIPSAIASKANAFIGLTDTVNLNPIGGPKLIFSNGVLIGVV